MRWITDASEHQDLSLPPGRGGKKLIVTDCLIEPGKFTRKDGEPRERAKVAFQMEDGRDYVVFSSSQQIIHYCRHFLSDKSRYLPVCLTIIKNNKQ